MRRVEIWRAGAWTAPSGVLAAGDVFRVFDEAGAPVVGEGGSMRWRVIAIGEPDAKGEVALKTEAIPETAVEAACAAEGFWFPGDATRDGDFGPPRRLR